MPLEDDELEESLEDPPVVVDPPDLLAVDPDVEVVLDRESVR